MKHLLINKRNKMKLCFIILPLSIILFSCASLDPRKVDVELKTTPPRIKTTSFTEALANLGLMTEIYGTDVLLIQSNPIGDKTGTSKSTGGEIPQDITEMMKSSLNLIGGNVVYIPYDPAFVQNQMVTGYSNFQNKLIPNVVLSGGITEFDRGLITKGENTDIDVGTDFTGMPDWLPSQEVQLRHNKAMKTGLARITLDFNLLDFQTMSGLSKMTTVNTMEVHKALGEKELGISIFGPSFGLRGSIKKVQGRHAAVRLLVELSTIQMVGKYLILPYWRLLGDDAIPDKVVMDTITQYFYTLNESERILKVQNWLYLYGYDLPLSGKLDFTTLQTIKQVYESYNQTVNMIDLDTFQKIYINIPLTNQALVRQHMITRKDKQQKEVEVADSSNTYSQSTREKKTQEESTPVQYEDLTTSRRKGIGKVLSKDRLIEILTELSQ